MAEVSQNPSRTVLVAVDNSEYSLEAFEWFLANISMKGMDEIILLHVAEQPHVPFLADALGIEEWKQEVKKVEEHVRAVEKKFIDRCKELELAHVTFKLEQGKPGEKICEVALKDKVKFIVLGSRGMGAIRRTVLGSVSTYVIHHTKIPVIFCPKDRN